MRAGIKIKQDHLCKLINKVPVHYAWNPPSTQAGSIIIHLFES